MPRDRAIFDDADNVTSDENAQIDGFKGYVGYGSTPPLAASGSHRERRAEPAAILAAQAGRLPRASAKISCNYGTSCQTGQVSSMRYATVGRLDWQEARSVAG